MYVVGALFFLMTKAQVQGDVFSNHPKVDHARAVKAYGRAAAGVLIPLPMDIRTPKTLARTNRFLITEILDGHHKDGSKAPEDSAIYAFLRDRFRAIRKDFRFQRYHGPELIDVLEAQVRYLIYAGYAHSHLEDHVFSKTQHQEQLMEAISSLMEAYLTERENGRPPPANEGEFCAYFILLKVLDPDAASIMDKKFGSNVALCPLMQWARQILCVLQHNVAKLTSPNHFMLQWGRYFRSLASERTRYLESCLLWRQVVRVRRRALLIMSNSTYLGGETAGPTLEHITEALWFDSPTDARHFIGQYGLGVSDATSPPAEVRLVSRRERQSLWRGDAVFSQVQVVVTNSHF